jgi:hypothetical protein
MMAIVSTSTYSGVIADMYTTDRSNFSLSHGSSDFNTVSHPLGNGGQFVTFASTSNFTTSVMSSNSFYVSTGTDWASGTSDFQTYQPTLVVEENEFCAWCGSEFFPNKSRPGTCDCCGGPRRFEYMPRSGRPNR